MPKNTQPSTATITELVDPLGALAPDRVILETVETETPHRRYVVGIDEQHGLQVREIDEETLQRHPRRVKGTRTVSELESFLAELSRRPLGGDGTLWGNAKRGELVAIYNDHDGDAAGWRDDVLALKLQPDPDWKRWHEISGQAFTQERFGDVIEELVLTVIDPDQADLLEVIDSVRASTKGQFQSEISRANGGQKVVYNTEVEAKAGRTRELEVPQLITLRLRPWEGHDTWYEIQAYFRLRVDHGELALSVKLKPTDWILREAWADITNGVSEAIGKPVYAQP
ncbi:DUF2303 family protein [Mycolicibacterium goodii]|uniref:DUF2303 family protein n=1 Tax=Mycolicibacterium goodii TaxID=134601 RepID=UPI001BDCA546|nr:DUF2303 family protein [Mycolicibacterium goodii]MBU8830869.1 YfdQ family protein [Mycolicibacterium goodii]